VAAAHIRDDLAQLYRRMAFNVLAGNRDDHLRDHGFLRTTQGWRLAPAFDLNPAREMREHATAISGRVISPTAADVLGVRSTFGLSEELARAIIGQVAAALEAWPEAATAAGISGREQRQVGVAFSALASVVELVS
jgi:serine/threonine-protein kinase HipA